MLKKLGLLSLVCLVAVNSPKANAQATPAETQTPQAQQQNQVVRPRLKMPNSIIVCRAKQCAPAKLSMAKEYIYNTLLHMFDSNARQKALVCAGNHNTHACTEEFVSIPITVGVTPAYLYIDDVKIADISISQQNTMALNLLLNWGISYNGQTPVCRPSKTLLYVKNIDNVIMEDNGYTCKMTTIGTTTVSTMFAIDYIDLDFGYIGGYYSIGLSGPAFGGASGYMIIRLPNEISVEAADFQVVPEKDNPDEETVVERVFSETKINNETIELMPEEQQPEAPAQMPQNPALNPTQSAVAPANPTFNQQPDFKPFVPANQQPAFNPQSNFKPASTNQQPAFNPQPAVPAMPTSAPQSGQYLYDANLGQYVPLQVQNTPQQQNPQYIPVPNPFQVPAPSVQPLTPVQQNYVPTVAPSTQEITLAPAYNQPVYAAPAMAPQAPYAQGVPQNPQAQAFGQYIYDSFTGQYIPMQTQYQFNPATGTYVPVAAMPQAQAPAKDNRKAAPNVDTIIKYNHPARQYEEAKAAAAAEAERVKKETNRQKKEAKRRQKMEEQAVDFGGVKVFPIPSSNLDKSKKEPEDKNTLSDYLGKTESRRFQ